MTAGDSSPVRHALGRIRRLAPRRDDLAAMRRTPRRDLVAGVTVGVVALPLALAFGIASGLGAEAGLVTAVVAGTLAAVFGGSHVQVSGPTGAMTVVLVPIFATHGAPGVLVVGLMAGVLLVAMATAGLGRYVRLIPLPVVEGFTLGIAVIIALQQVPAALGVPAEGEKVLLRAADAAARWIRDPQPAEALLTVVVVLLVLAVLRYRPALPGALIAVVAATVAAAAGGLDVAVIGALPRGLPVPSLPGPGSADLGALVLPAVAVAALAALESLLSATVADAMTVSERHDPDRELFGQGIANLVAPLFGGVPATAAIARTAVNVRSGAHSRLAAVTHAVFLLGVVLVLAPAVAAIPLAALAGVLIVTAARMVEVSKIHALLRSGRSDALVLLVTFLATVVLDLATAVLIGIVVAGAAALRQVARSATVEPIARDEWSSDHTDEEQALLDDHIVAYRLEGPLFFAGAHTALLSLTEVSDIRVVVLRMSHVTALDATAASVLVDTIRDLESRGVAVVVSGLEPRFHAALARGGALERLTAEGRFFARTPEAIAAARSLAGRAPGAVVSGVEG